MTSLSYVEHGQRHTTTGRVNTFSGEAGRERWRGFIAGSGLGHLMQSCEWGDYKAALGWKVQRIGVERDGQIVAGAQMLLRRLPWLPLTIAYIPKGPIVDLEDVNATTTLLSAIHHAARRQRAIFLKIEPNLRNEISFQKALERYNFQPSVHSNQPRSTIVVELRDGEDAVLSHMRKTTRKLIRRAVRDGVEIVTGESQDIDSFHNILRTTAEIKGFPVHDKAFYEQAWKAFRKAGCVHLLLAKYQGETVAGKMVFVFGDRSMHLWGGTSQKGRDVNASYLLQWESIKWAIARGCKTCDLWGIPDEIGEMLRKGQDVPKERKGGLWGVFTFKRGFGGEIESYVGAYDYVYLPVLYLVAIKILTRGSTVDAVSRLLEQVQG